MTSTPLSAAQADRARGTLVASAVGDALGAGYEFGSPPEDGRPGMIGGGLGGFAPGEWTDDTAQAVAIAVVAATGADLTSTTALDRVAAGFTEWFDSGPPDVGVQTARVLGEAGAGASAERMAATARTLHRETGRSAGNGSLMRTAPVALAHLDDPEVLVQAAMAVSALTHYDPLAGEGCALWCLMIRYAVLQGELPRASDVLDHVPRADDWAAVLVEAEREEPSVFTDNGWVVGALQAAWSAIRHTPVPHDEPARHLPDALATAIGIGNDTDTVAAIAGALLGARWGDSAVPRDWRAVTHGWAPQAYDGRMTADQLAELAGLASRTVGGGVERGDDATDQEEGSR